MKEQQAVYIPERLCSLWKRVQESKITFITAPAGFGKSTLVRRWSELMSRDVVWMEISDTLSKVPQALSVHIQHISNEYKFQPVHFVLDHIHRLRHPDALTELKNWIVHSDNRARFILLSRETVPQLSNCSELLHEQFRLTSNDLKLSLEESQVWFFHKSEIDAILLSDIYPLTDGCPALIHLAVQHARSGQEPLMDGKKRITPYLESYVLEEWLQDLPESIREEIQPLCMTPYFTIDFAKDLLRKDVNSLILQLERHCLLSKTFVRNGWFYRLHPIVRSVINERYPPAQETRTSMKEKAALFLNQEGLMKEAAEVALEADMPMLALQSIKKMAPDLLRTQDYHWLRKWFNGMDRDVIEQDKETSALFHRISGSTDCFTLFAPEDGWSPYVSLNHGSLPFIRQTATFEGDINKIKQQTMNAKVINPYALPFRHLALAEALYEQNQLLEARKQLIQVWESAGPSHHHPGLSIPALWLTLLCDQVEGRQKETHFVAEEIYYRSLQTPIPIWRRIGRAVRTFVLLQEGHIEDAAEWVSEQKDLLPVYWDQWISFEYFMFARALIVLQEIEEANNLLRRMLTASSLERSPGVTLERTILQTIAAVHLERHEESRLYIRSALEIGWKYGYKRLFLDHDPVVFLPMNEIQTELPEHLQSYCKQILQLGNKKDLKDISNNPKLKNALTLREIQILQYIRQGMSNRTIGVQMHISEGTVKGHLHRIFKKLNVKNRVQAVKVAEHDRMI